MHRPTHANSNASAHTLRSLMSTFCVPLLTVALHATKTTHNVRVCTLYHITTLVFDTINRYLLYTCSLHNDFSALYAYNHTCNLFFLRLVLCMPPHAQRESTCAHAQEEKKASSLLHIFTHKSTFPTTRGKSRIFKKITLFCIGSLHQVNFTRAIKLRIRGLLAWFFWLISLRKL